MQFHRLPWNAAIDMMCLMEKNLKALVFDMDGVLLDSESICDEIWELLARQMGLPDIQAAIAENRGCNEAMMAKNLTVRYGPGFDCPKFFSDFRVYFTEVERSRGIPLLPQVRETLDYLKGRGYRLALATSTRRSVAMRQLKAAGVWDFFEAQAFGDEVEHSKPAPDIYLKAAQELGVEPGLCAGIEDSPNGIISVHRAGFKAIMVPDRIQPSDEIKKLCWKIGKPLSTLREFL